MNGRCDHRLWQDEDAVQCQLDRWHKYGHVYAASDCPDAHTSTEPNGDDQ